MYFKSVITASILGISLAGCSLLKPHYSEAQMHGYLFDKFDANKDGTITQTEYFDFIDERFEKMNPDGGETITKDELYETRFYTYLPELAEAVFRDSDTDGNGIITYPEMVAAEQTRFAQMDTDHDGRLTLSEFVVNDMALSE